MVELTHCASCGALLTDLGDVDVVAAVEAATAGPVFVPGELPPLDDPPSAA